MSQVTGYRTTRLFGFVWPPKWVLSERRILDASDWKIAIPGSLLPYLGRIEIYGSVPDRVAKAVLIAVTEASSRHNPFPLMNFNIATNQKLLLIGRLATEGIEPTLSSLVPPWLPGGDNELPDAKYEILRDAILQNEATYAEMSSRYLVRVHTRFLAQEVIEASANRIIHGRYGSEDDYYNFNKQTAEVIEEYLPGLCTAWRYAEANLDFRTTATDWRALQAEFGMFP